MAAAIAPQVQQPLQQQPQSQPLQVAPPPPAPQPPAQGTDQSKPFFGAPTAKVGTGVLAGAMATLIAAILKGHVNWITDAAAVSAMTSLLTFVVQYLVPERT